MSDRAKSHMGGSKAKKSGSKSKSKPHEIHVKRAHGGGFIAKHHHKSKAGEEQQEPEEHVLSDMGQLQAHMQDSMGDQPPAGTPPQGGQPAPQAQVAPQAAPMGM